MNYPTYPPYRPMKSLPKPAQYQYPAQYAHPAQYPAQPAQYAHPAQYAQHTVPAWSLTAYLSGATAFAGMFVWTFIVALGESGVNPFVLNATHVFGVGFTLAGTLGFIRFLATGNGKMLFVFMLAFGLSHAGKAYVSTQAANRCYIKTSAGNYDPQRSSDCLQAVQNETLNRVLGGVK